MSTYTLRFEEPIDTWLNSDSAKANQAEALLERNHITVLDCYGGAGVGQWSNGKHETSLVIEADECTAQRMATLIQAEIGYLVTVTEDEDEDEEHDTGLASDEALQALREKLTGHTTTSREGKLS